MFATSFHPRLESQLRALTERPILNQHLDSGERVETGEALVTIRNRDTAYATTLDALSTAVENLSSAMLSLSKGAQDRPEPTKENLVAAARHTYRARRVRESFFSPALLGEPAWDMLLELYVATIEGKAVQTTSCVISSTAPPSTALRWIVLLEGEGLIERNASSTDRRVIYVSMTDIGIRRMEDYLSNIICDNRK